MAFGVDYVSGPSPAELKSAGVVFACRYLSEVNQLTQVKLLTPNEAKALSAAGIALVSNWEWYAGRPTEGFSAGVADARIAASQHADCGGPSTRPIYFSVDADVSGDQVLQYFKGVASIIGIARTGAYGSYRVLKYLFDVGAITWGWQTYAWSYGTWESRAHIQQYRNDMSLSGHSVDYDRSIKSDFGQWLVGGVQPMANGVPSGWSDDGTTLRSPSGVPIVLGFRDYVLANNWDAANVPLGPQYYTQLLEQFNQELGDGDQIVFLYGDMLGYPHNPQGAMAGLKDKVIHEWAGKELNLTRDLVAKYYPLAKQIPDLQAQLASLTQQLNEAKAAQIAGLDATLVANHLSAIGLQIKQGQDALTQAQNLVVQPIS